MNGKAKTYELLKVRQIRTKCIILVFISFLLCIINCHPLTFYLKLFFLFAICKAISSLVL